MTSVAPFSAKGDCATKNRNLRMNAVQRDTKWKDVGTKRYKMKDECATAISEFHAMRFDHAKNFTHPFFIFN